LVTGQRISAKKGVCAFTGPQGGGGHLGCKSIDEKNYTKLRLLRDIKINHKKTKGSPDWGKVSYGGMHG